MIAFCGFSGGFCSPERLLNLIDAHAQGIGQWLKVAGMEKAALLDSALQHHAWMEGHVAVEFGAFVGYTSVRLAAYHYDSPFICRSVSLEVDHVHQAIARLLLDVTKLSPCGEVWNGQVRDLVPRVLEEFGAQAVAFTFMDHRGTRFHDDFAHIVRSGSQALVSELVADNVLNPGSPVFAWNTLSNHLMTAWSLTEFMTNSREDWMVVATGITK
mmetsp:Transcript_31243/g.50192  ORF Transcript_31243/g.50192 Transcript_31243/m.50192 type:complete len:214 (+) Transcript_31243:471-1112(+)